MTDATLAADDSAPVEISEEEAVRRLTGEGLQKQSPEAEAEDDEAEEPSEAKDEAERPSEEESDEAEKKTEGEADQAKQPAFEPPARWSDDAKAVFQKLPHEAQALLLDRHKAMEADHTRRTQDAARVSKEAEAERKHAAEQRQLYAGQLAAIAAQTEKPPYSQEDLAKLKAEDPLKWVEATEMNRQHVENRRALEDERRKLAFFAERDRERAYQRALKEGRERLPDLIPEWRDEALAKKESDALGQYLMAEEFTPEEVSSIIDPRILKVARKAWLFDQLQKSKPVVEKRVREAPKVIPSGPAKGSKQTAEADRQAALLKQVRRTGTTDAAVALLASRMKK